VSGVPAAAWAVGVAGLVPFLYGAAMLVADKGALPGFGLVIAAPEGGAAILARFGAVILGFMGGCLWGFASSGGRRPSPGPLAAASVPAFLAFVALGGDPARSCALLALGFAVLQAIDVGFARAGIAPDYWLALRLPLTAVVIVCLLAGAVLG
jgi:hypothetical protein